MFYDIASFPWWLLAVALIGVIVGWATYADTPRRGWLEGWAIWGAVAFVVGLVIAVLKLLPGEAGLWLEIALLVMFLYILGCLLGGWLKSMWLKPARHRAEEAAQTGVALKASAKVEADGQAEQLAAQAEQDRLAVEAAAKVEAESRVAAAHAEQDRLAAEAATKAEADSRTAAVQAERDRLAAEAAAKAEADSRAAAVQAEQDRLAAEAAAKDEAERHAAAAQAEQDRLAAEAAAKAEAERHAAAAQEEQDRLAAEAAAKAEAESRAAAAQAEQDRLAAEAAAKVEAESRIAAAQAEQDRLAAEAAAKAEAERHAAAAQEEQDRLAAEAAAKAEAERHAAAAQAEQDRLAAEAAAKAEADLRAAAPKTEQDRSATETAAKAEADRQATAVAAPGIRPPALGAPQDAADDLKLIKGVGPNNERTLNGLGVYHFSQISDWSADHATWIGHQMAFPGRIERESWIPQAKLLAAGFDTDHSAGVKSGVINIDEGADTPMSEAEAHSLADGLPALMPAVEGEERHAGARPLGLAAPRGGIADDLKRIKRIGKQNEARLHRLGVWHLDQIAAWSAENVKWVGSYLGIAGRIDRERWIAQAQDFASTEFARRVEVGLVATSLDDGSRGQDDIVKVEPKGG